MHLAVKSTMCKWNFTVPSHRAYFSHPTILGVHPGGRMNQNSILWWLDTIFFSMLTTFKHIYSPVDRLVECSPCERFGITLQWTSVCVSGSLLSVLWGVYRTVGSLQHVLMSAFSPLRNCWTFERNWTVLHSHQQCKRVSFFLYLR